MIATIRFQRGMQSLEAVLNDKGIWMSQDPVLEDFLRTVYPVTESHVSDGVPGRLQAMQAATALDGTVEFPPDDDEDPNAPEVIY